MAIEDDVAKVKGNIGSIYERRRQAVYALSLNYAARALSAFRSAQSQERFWKNQTKQALNRMFSDAQLTDNVVSWFMAHGVSYGVYLELANDRQHEALRPIIAALFPRFKRDLDQIYGAP